MTGKQLAPEDHNMVIRLTMNRQPGRHAVREPFPFACTCGEHWRRPETLVAHIADVRFGQP